MIPWTLQARRRSHQDLSKFLGRADCTQGNGYQIQIQIPEEDRALDINLRNEEFPSIKTLGSM